MMRQNKNSQIKKINKVKDLIINKNRERMIKKNRIKILKS